MKELFRKIAYKIVCFFFQERGIQKVKMEYGCSICKKYETNDREDIFRHIIDAHHIRTVKKPRIKHGQIEWQQSPKDFIVKRD